MEKKKLTERQKTVLEYIRQQISNHGSSPTIREIGKFMNISSTNGVRMHISALIKKGFLKKNDHIARGLELTSQIAHEVIKLSVVGTVPAGLPIDAIENIEGELVLDASFLPKGESFSLIVSGESMKDCGIYDGDNVIVQKQNVANQGDIVVAIIGDEATVKRYFKTDTHIELHPENKDFDIIIIDENSPPFHIAGKVVGLIRKF